MGLRASCLPSPYPKGTKGLPPSVYSLLAPKVSKNLPVLTFAMFHTQGERRAGARATCVNCF